MSRHILYIIPSTALWYVTSDHAAIHALADHHREMAVLSSASAISVFNCGCWRREFLFKTLE
jgi:hypothetical protein